MKAGSAGIAAAAACVVLLIPTYAMAQTQPPNRDLVSHAYRAGSETVVGRLRTYVTQKGDTFLDIARRFGLGYNELLAANVHADPWIPEVGEEILLSTEWVLPDAPHNGLVMNIPEMRMYYYVGRGSGARVLTFPVGLGRQEWQTPQAEFTVRGKTENPTWVIPDTIRKERLEEDGLTETMIAGGIPENPLGKYRLELTLPSYAIHGTNKDWGIGMKVSHGCVRLYPEDIASLFPIVEVGARGRFVYQPVKVGVTGGRVLVEVHEDIYNAAPWTWRLAQERITALGVGERVDKELLEAAVEAASGIPTDVTKIQWAEGLATFD